MKTPLFITLYLTLALTSCGQKNCDQLNYQSINWQEIDSKTSFYICSNSEKKPDTKGLIEIQYLGILENGDNTVKYLEADKEMFALFSNIPLGQFNISDTTLPINIRCVLNQLTRKSEATVKYNMGNIKPNKPEKRIIVYFKKNIDSITAATWITNLNTRPYVDSTYYLSKDAALSNWSKEDTTWKSLLIENPLPSSVDVFIKPDFVDSSFIRKLKDELRESILVSEITNSSSLSENDLKEINDFLMNPYLIRIKWVE